MWTIKCKVGGTAFETTYPHKERRDAEWAFMVDFTQGFLDVSPSDGELVVESVTQKEV